MIGEITASSFEPDFFWYVFLPIGIWLLGIIILMTTLIVKFTFGKWTKEEQNPFQKETLGVPRGVMRGILTLTLVYVVVLFETYNLNSSIPETGYIEFLMAFKMMIAFYFGSKVAHHVATTEHKKAKLAGEPQDTKTKPETPFTPPAKEIPSVENMEYEDEDEEAFG